MHLQLHFILTQMEMMKPEMAVAEAHGKLYPKQQQQLKIQVM